MREPGAPGPSRATCDECRATLARLRAARKRERVGSLRAVK